MTAPTTPREALPWTPDQFWEYVEGLTDKFTSDQMRDMMANRRLVVLGNTQAVPDPPIVRQHIAWLFQYVQGMEASNWRDMKMNAERQLEQLSLMFPGRAHSSTEGK